jgi:DNA mismatch endonuclease (patch repair protein)
VLSGLAVRPDIVLRKHRLAVFLDGCFWHSCPSHGTRPRSNEYYWLPKLRRVRRRDRRVTEALESGGWRVIRIWEHMRPEEAAECVLSAVLRG